MGKTLNHHPVSLTVIRAAVIYCGWRFGKITQTSINHDRTRATYVAEVTGFAAGYEKRSNILQRKGLQECFNADIRAITVWTTKRGKTYVSLETNLNPRLGASGDQDAGQNALDRTGYASMTAD